MLGAVEQLGAAWNCVETHSAHCVSMGPLLLLPASWLATPPSAPLILYMVGLSFTLNIKPKCSISPNVIVEAFKKPNAELASCLDARHGFLVVKLPLQDLL
ncbi:hypothetical protein DPEC_G00110960 [Dallia pectoralis]|uniref:Uncharacterized protein n=1 Tax=Dallia pectoralis TaxID=75939 RepID=A0ACC2GSW9_DALPE|nr:hypothetical protein DPEC_G00110960 [Dallia pectoralis]